VAHVPVLQHVRVFELGPIKKHFDILHKVSSASFGHISGKK
jgi:hypothetical protein